MEFAHTVKHARDVHEHAANLQGWEQRYEQLSAGTFTGRVEAVRAGPVQVFSEWADQAILQGGTHGPGWLSIAVACPGAQRSWYCGHRLATESLIALSAESDFQLVTAPNTRILALSVQHSYLEAMAQTLEHTTLAQLPTTPSVALVTAAQLTQIKCLLNSAMDIAPDGPTTLHPNALNAWAQTLAEGVLACLVEPLRTASTPLSARSHQRLVDRAREHILAHPDQPVTIPELCLAIGASRRALQYAFEDVTQLSPVQYLRTMRLNRVRLELRHRPETPIADIASRWGFWHLSRFAADYKRLFGERPSHTQARSH